MSQGIQHWKHVKMAQNVRMYARYEKKYSLKTIAKPTESDYLLKISKL